MQFMSNCLMLTLYTLQVVSNPRHQQPYLVVEPLVSRGVISFIVIVLTNFDTFFICHIDEIGVVESVKAASEIYTPVSGKVKEVNKNSEDTPNLVNKSPYEDGWIFKIEMSHVNEFDKLMSQDEYENTYLKSIKH